MTLIGQLYIIHGAWCKLIGPDHFENRTAYREGFFSWQAIPRLMTYHDTKLEEDTDYRSYKVQRDDLESFPASTCIGLIN